MTLEFIGIQHLGQHPRVTNFAVSDKAPSNLLVGGTLTHGTVITFDKPNAAKLITFLQAIVGPATKEPSDQTLLDRDQIDPTALVAQIDDLCAATDFIRKEFDGDSDHGWVQSLDGIYHLLGHIRDSLD